MFGLNFAKILLFFYFIGALYTPTVEARGAVHPSDPCPDRCMDYWYCMNYNNDERACAWKKKDCTCSRG
ncbi:hypothetical protein QR680_004036 [Steinernema hermaphroditum]|uniref:ShKT domain-containing protein n=1 Tax=Steinernema hermaphroditum TaxID=289476 RepID=A0AA39HNV9_9BILA|nr:hypothetical protein QR680_004036 [Steinernema hermaphroditum]